MKYIIFIAIATLMGGLSVQKEYDLQDSDKIWDVLENLGDDASHVKPDMSNPKVSVDVGRNIVTQGFSNTPGTAKSKRQSKHFVCTSCHNIEREDPDLTVVDPQARLEYVTQKGMPFLQATTLYGAINREYFYNGDYEKKYGDLVKPARHDIREAVKLCAVECAQGRTLKDWELESIIAYLWDIQLTVDDLSLTGSEKRYISGSIEDSLSWLNANAILRTKYVSYSPATFIAPPEDRKAGTGLEGDPDNGKLIYDNSCLHCHNNKRYSFLHLDDTQMSFNHLNAKIGTYKPHSIYQVIRWGTYSKNWKKSYMPQYTEEKMSDQMLTDLRAYIEKRANS